MLPYLLMLACQRLQIKKLFHKLGNSYQTYINFHKTHAVATHYGGIGDTSMNNPESHDMDNDSQDTYQEDVNDQEHTEFNPPVALIHFNSQNGAIKANCQGQGQ